MKWINKRSGNVEDRRGMSGGRGLAIGGIGGIVVLILAWIMGGDPSQLMSLLEQGNPQSNQTEYTPSAQEDSLAQFVSMVLAETEEVWDENFRKLGKTYREPKLVLFTGQTTSGCGHASKISGPFYCPADEKIYLDLSFYTEMKEQLGAGGDFAFAYVIAHEVGHHVQKLLGVMDRYAEAHGQGEAQGANSISVRTELQADFYAGLWAHHAERLFRNLDEDDIDEALNAATAIGDDRLQQQSQGYVVPDSFTHGTSAQRKKWFYKGYTTGDLRQGNTFETHDL